MTSHIPRAGPLLRSLVQEEWHVDSAGSAPDVVILAFLVAGFALSLLLLWRYR